MPQHAVESVKPLLGLLEVVVDSYRHGSRLPPRGSLPPLPDPSFSSHGSVQFSLFLIVERSARGGFVKFQIFQQIVHDLAVVEAHLRKLSAADLHHLMNVTGLPGIRVIDRRVSGVGGSLGRGTAFTPRKGVWWR